MRTAPDPTPNFRVASKRRFAQLGMRGQSQVIVGGEIDDLLAVKRTDRRLLIIEHAELEMCALGFEFVELIGQVRERIRASRASHECLGKVFLPRIYAEPRGSLKISLILVAVSAPLPDRPVTSVHNSGVLALHIFTMTTRRRSVFQILVMRLNSRQGSADTQNMIGFPVAMLASQRRFMLSKNSFSPSVRMSLDPKTRSTSLLRAGDCLTGMESPVCVPS